MEKFLTSNALSCLTAQTHTAIEAIDMKSNGIKTSIQRCLPDSSLSQASSSNMSSMRCRARLINMAL
jgi:hypothetical protein